MTLLKRAQLARYPQPISERFKRGAVTIGNFDGVHRGHERLLTVLKAVADGRPTVVVSFYPHPIRVLRRDAGLRYISSIREKAESFGTLGIDLLYFIHFTKTISEMSAHEFIHEVLVKALDAKDLVVGEDVAIGKGREGDLAFLRRELPTVGVALHVVPALAVEGVKAGSRKIREYIEGGDVKGAMEIIGAPFTISARVGHGDKRGSAIGFPTANIAVGARLIPKRGVYACRVEVDGNNYDAVANIGIRPTFQGQAERLEAHILDFPSQSLYGKRIHVAFIGRLRDEKKFDSIDALRAQIQLDIQAARLVCAQAPK